MGKSHGMKVVGTHFNAVLPSGCRYLLQRDVEALMAGKTRKNDPNKVHWASRPRPK